jgi:hypothetical protein
MESKIRRGFFYTLFSEPAAAYENDPKKIKINFYFSWLSEPAKIRMQIIIG